MSITEKNVARGIGTALILTAGVLSIWLRAWAILRLIMGTGGPLEVLVLVSFMASLNAQLIDNSIEGKKLR